MVEIRNLRYEQGYQQQLILVEHFCLQQSMHLQQLLHQ
ncbi:hypothetical protein SynA1562_01783 [Synechococcus sp. A15-62]|nr:hypothetical protein SynA1562_01783 [Synechococcus sp. A15-62]